MYSKTIIEFDFCDIGLDYSGHHKNLLQLLFIIIRVMNKFGQTLSESPIRLITSMIADRIVRRINLKQSFSLWKRIKYFLSTLRWRNLKT